MVFIGQNDILVLEKNSGKVDRILNGSMLDEPLIDVNSFHQDGLIGIATTKSQNGLIYVFSYFTEAPLKYGADVDSLEEAKKGLYYTYWLRCRMVRWKFFVSKNVIKQVS